jgi:hypothetical protein
MAVNKGITHKISQKIKHNRSISTGIKIFTNRISWYRHFNRAQRVQRQGFQTGKISRYGINRVRGKIQAGFNPNRAHLAFSKADQCSFFSITSAVSKSNQIVRIFQHGSGSKLSTVPTIFTGQSRSFIKQKVAGFKRKT